MARDGSNRRGRQRRERAALTQLPRRALRNPYAPIEVLSADQIEAIHHGKPQLSVPLGLSWDEAGYEVRSLVSRVRAAWGRQKPGGSEPHGEAALQRLNLVDHRSGTRPSPQRGSGLSRGDVFSTTVSAIALPTGERRPVTKMQ